VKLRFRCPEAARYLEDVHGLPIGPTTLNKLRSIGGGPIFHKYNRTVLYPRQGLDDWAREKLGRPRRSTSDVDR
jgi:hypothetical protein